MKSKETPQLEDALWLALQLATDAFNDLNSCPESTKLSAPTVASRNISGIVDAVG